MDSFITWFLVGILYGVLRKPIHAVLHYIFQGLANAFAPKSPVVVSPANPTAAVSPKVSKTWSRSTPNPPPYPAPETTLPPV